LVEENQFLRERVDAETELHGIVGASAKIQDVLRMISRLKDTRTPVLIAGESGTGKELVARAIHFRGSFANRPFVAVDCGSLVPTLIESELSAMRKALSLEQSALRPGFFNPRTVGRFFWMKLEGSRWRCRPNCCGSCRRRRFVRWAAIRKLESMYA